MNGEGVQRGKAPAPALSIAKVPSKERETGRWSKGSFRSLIEAQAT